MQRNLRNTVAVLVVTALTALAVFATVQLTARVTGLSTVTAAAATEIDLASSQYGDNRYAAGQSTSGEFMTCPATGCKASSCHAAH